jgi:hypothetical protein
MPAVLADQPLLLPLTESLYVKGKVANTEQLLVNIGTDYYVEVSLLFRVAPRHVAVLDSSPCGGVGMLLACSMPLRPQHL